MPRNSYRWQSGTSPGEGSQGREAPPGSLDGSVQGWLTA